MQLISTSEIKISVVIDEKYLELAVRSLHSAFGLDQEPHEQPLEQSLIDLVSTIYHIGIFVR
jgi:hypothetical protein